ncbi:unnamed protein product [Diamesa serratosioi]
MSDKIVVKRLKKVVSLTMELQVDQIEQILNSKTDKLLIEKFETFDRRLKKIENTLDQMIETLKEKKMIQPKKISKESLLEPVMSEKFVKTINFANTPNNSTHQSSTTFDQDKSELKYFEDINLKMQNLLTLKSKLSEYAMKFDKMKNNAGRCHIYHMRNEQPEARKAKNFGTVNNFFENLRFDFKVDDKLNVNLMRVVTDESIKGKLDHDLIVYKRVLFNTLKLIGASSFAEMKPRSIEESNIISTKRDIAVDALFCSTTCLESCDLAVCDVCLPCVNHEKFRDLHTSYREHIQQGEMKRIFPSNVHFKENFIEKMTPNNQFMIKWFQAKCFSDVTWYHLKFQQRENKGETLKFWPFIVNTWNKNDNLRTMKRVFNRLQYEEVNGSQSDWDVLWSIEYPFELLRQSMLTLKSQQKFVENPLLIDGRVFDLGVYVVISSINPLRIYRYKAEVLSRFCPEPYSLFDQQNVEKYVIYETQNSVWEMPSLSNYINKLGYSFKKSIEIHLKSRGYNISSMWEQIDDAIVSLILQNEKHFISELKQFHSQHNFFELLRFDFIMDAEMNVYLMEVNMSPNLTPTNEKFENYSLGYEQLIFNTMKTIGAGSYGEMKQRSREESKMFSSGKNIAVNALFCSESCNKSCFSAGCELCLSCMNGTGIKQIHRSYREHMNRGEMKRIFPNNVHFQEEIIKQMTPANQFMTNWFHAKCQEDKSWCS